MPLDVAAQIENWRSLLLDTSKRNRLINFTTGRTGGISLAFPQPDSLWERLLDSHMFTFIWQRELLDLPPVNDSLDLEELSDGEESALEDGSTANTAAQPDSSVSATQDPETNYFDECLESPRLRPTKHLLTRWSDRRLGKRLSRIAMNAKESMLEQGVSTLFVAFGMLRWYESSDSTVEVLSPLLLVPARLDRDTVESPWELEAEEDEVLPNVTLAQLLSRDFRLRLPVPDAETDKSTAAWRAGYFEEVRQSIKTHDPRWEVLDEVALGLFHFQKLAMWEDLGRNRDRIAAHPLCRAIAGEPSTPSELPVNLPDAKDLDEVALPEKTFHLLDCDSSQHVAIEVVKRGANLVLDGPPGTGKSQTIANIIAEFLAAGKTVLFVSEKAAALEVVQRRLQENGVGDFCLACHSHKANKREIVADLARSLDLKPERYPDNTEDLQRLRDIRQKLNEYVRQLHTVREPLGKTVYQVNGELARLQHLSGRSRCAITNILERDTDYLRQREDLLARLPECRVVLDHYKSHPWRGCRAGTYSPAFRDDLEYHLKRLAKCIPTLQQAAKALQQRGLTGENPSGPELLKALTISRMMYNSAAWWENSARQELLQQLNRWVQCKRDAKSIQDVLHTKLTATAFESASAPLASRAVRYTSLWSRFLPSWWFLRAQLKSWYPHGLPAIPDLLEDLKKLTEFHQHLAFCQRTESERAADLLSNDNCKVDVPETLKRLELLEQSGNADATRADLAKALARADEATANGFADSWGFLLQLFDPSEEVSTGVTLDATPLADLRTWLEQRAADAERLHEWVRYRDLEQALRQADMGAVLTEIQNGELLLDEAAAAFRARFFSLWLDATHEIVPAVRRFVTDRHEQLIERFRELDRAAIASGQARIRTFQLSRADRPTLTMGNAPPSSELGKLMREVHKKRGHLPLRNLFAAVPNLLLRVKPCLMMSPLAVSTYLGTPDIEFDLVIFDEASQVRPHDAICAIYRGRHLVVAGDQKQLPPTSFFDRAADNQESSSEEGGLNDYESILDVCCTLGLPRRRLRWHYRSRREGLIAFANQLIYDNELVTFPSVHDTANNPAVRFEYVANGCWTRGTGGGFNALEGRRTAELVMEHFRDSPHLSLGVIAFSERQQRRVLDELERLRRANPQLESFFRDDAEDPFFVKNLENVQGDERDVILLAIGYGPDDNGRILMNFGPLNKQGGERRLNVAVTRARHHMLVISSMRAADLDLSRSNARGVAILRALLDYAERGIEALRGVITGVGGGASGRGWDSPFEQQVYEELTRQGLTVHPQVGCSSFHLDMAVIDSQLPGRYLLGVECDGATYHSSATARDRDRLRQEVLENLGWKFCRIWSTDWVRDRQGQVQRVLKAVQKAIQDVQTGTPPSPGKTTATRVHSQPLEAAPIPAANNKQVHAQYASITDVPEQVLDDVIIQQLTLLGATENDDLIRTITKELNFRRTGPKIRARLTEALHKLLAAGRITRASDGRIQVVAEEKPIHS